MNEQLSIYEYEIESSAEVSKTVLKVLELRHKYLVGFIYSFIHNTVAVQSLKRELEKVLPAMEISLLKHTQKTGVKFIVYGYDGEVHEKNLIQEVLSLLTRKSATCQKLFDECKEELIRKYFYDQLTALPNIYKLRKELEEATATTLISVTIDDFKTINTSYGFLAGDYILEKVAQFLLQRYAKNLYKLPGREFIVHLSECYNYYELIELLQKLYDEMTQLHIDYMGLNLRLNYTVVACSMETNENIFSKLSLAQIYAQKNKLPYYIYEDKLDIEYNFKDNIQFSSLVLEAIEQDKVLAYYQPIVDNTTDTIAKYETLARLVDTKGDILSPEKFIEVAKQTKVYPAIIRKMLDSAFETFGDTSYEFSINISKDDLLNSTTKEYILKKLQQNPQIAKRVIFEFIESDAISQTEKVLEFVSEIKRYGAKIAIDDFGNGYSNFLMLAKMKVDFIKIDGTLISELDTSASTKLIVESIVEFAKKLGIKVIAEYVYTSTIYSKVQAMGIEFSQGFYIDQPKISINK